METRQFLNICRGSKGDSDWRSLLHQYIGSWVRYEQNGGKKNKTITNVKVNIIFTAQTVRNDWIIPVEIKVAETDSEISDKDPNIQIVT